jgi:hypothetical protein
VPEGLGQLVGICLRCRYRRQTDDPLLWAAKPISGRVESEADEGVDNRRCLTNSSNRL